MVSTGVKADVNALGLGFDYRHLQCHMKFASTRRDMGNAKNFINRVYLSTLYVGVAHLVEHCVANAEVEGSQPFTHSTDLCQCAGIGIQTGLKIPRPLGLRVRIPRLTPLKSRTAIKSECTLRRKDLQRLEIYKKEGEIKYGKHIYERT